MSALLHLVEGIIELWCSWRFYLCVGVGLGAGFLLHRMIPEETWVWFLSVPVGLVSLAGGFWWQFEADRER